MTKGVENVYSVWEAGRTQYITCDGNIIIASNGWCYWSLRYILMREYPSEKSIVRCKIMLPGIHSWYLISMQWAQAIVSHRISHIFSVGWKYISICFMFMETQLRRRSLLRMPHQFHIRRNKELTVLTSTYQHVKNVYHFYALRSKLTLFVYNINSIFFLTRLTLASSTYICLSSTTTSTCAQQPNNRLAKQKKITI